MGRGRKDRSDVAMTYRGWRRNSGKGMKEKVGRNLMERREGARDEDTEAFIFIERTYTKAHELKVIMRYNLYASLRDFVLNFSLSV